MAAMQCVSSGSNFAWHQCYQLLLQAVEGYNIALDPRDSVAGRSCCYNIIAGRSCCYNIALDPGDSIAGRFWGGGGEKFKVSNRL